MFNNMLNDWSSLFRAAVIERRLESARLLDVIILDSERSIYLYHELNYLCNYDDQYCNFTKLLLGSQLKLVYPDAKRIFRVPIENNNFNILKTLIEGLGIDSISLFDLSFKIAAKTNKLEILWSLFNYFKSVESKYKLDCSLRQHRVLAHCDALAHPDALALLLKAGGHINDLDWRGHSVLHKACIANKLDSVELLLSAGANIRARAEFGPPTVLHVAIKARSNLEIIKRLLDSGLLITDCNELGETAIYLDCDGYGNTLFHYAVKHIWPIVLELLIKQLASDFAKSLGHPEQSWTVKRAVAGVLNHQNKDGRTALHTAVLPNRRYIYYDDQLKQILDLLLINGANPDTTDFSRNTPLRTTFLNQHQVPFTLIMDKLIEHGADPNHRDSKGETPLFFATRYQPESVLLYLREISADLNSCNLSGKTLLSYALSDTERDDLLEFLLKSGADLISELNKGHSSNEAISHWTQLKNYIVKFQLARLTLLQAKLIELDAAGFLESGVTDEYYEYIYSNRMLPLPGELSLADKRSSCEKELERLKSVRLKPHLSLYDWFTSYRLRTRLYVRDGRLIERLDALDWRLYPNYGPTMRNVLKTDKYKEETVSAAIAALTRLLELARPKNELNRLPFIPLEICDEILAYWNQCELCIFVQEAKRIDRQLKSCRIVRNKNDDTLWGSEYTAIIRGATGFDGRRLRLFRLLSQYLI